MTLFDYAVLAISGFSLLLGVLRGLSREVMALVAWAAAFIVAGAVAAFKYQIWRLERMA